MKKTVPRSLERVAVRVPKSQRMDGWKNLVTLLGTSADKRTASRITWEYRDPEFFEQMYAGGGIPARIVDLIPDEACRRWIDWEDLEDEEEDMIETRCKQLDLRGTFLRSWKWGRAFGGGLLHIVTDTSDPASPLRPGEKILALRDLTRWDVRVLTTDIEYDFGSPNFGHPRIYYLNVQMGSQYKGYPIHWTRMIRFDGQLVPRRTFIRNNYWHDSILNRLYDTIRDYQMSNDAAAACLLDFNVDVMKMKGLANMVGSGKERIVQKRMQVIQYAKSVLNMILIDSDTEEYENKGRSLEGVADLLKHQANRLVAETDIPHTKLLGESPDGSNSTGNSTSQAWYNFIQSEQDNYARAKLERLLKIIFPDIALKFHFRSLRVLDDAELADLHLKQAQTDTIYVADQVLDPTEVAKSRFGGKEYSIETELDQEARDAGLFGLSGPDQAEQNAALAPDMTGDMETDPDGSTGDEPPEGNKPPETGKPNPPQKPGGKGNPKAFQKKDGIEGSETLALQYAPRDIEASMPAGKPVAPKTKPIVSQMMSEPMRDPATDPHMPGPGIPNQPRTIMPTTGNGVTAESGAKAGEPVAEIPLRPEGQLGVGQEDHIASYDSGVEETMKEFAKGTLKSGSGHKVTDPKQAAAIGYSEERGDEEKPAGPKRACQIIVRDGDKVLMGKRREGGAWAFPGGHVEDGESHHQGAVRELAEETGLESKRLKFLGGRSVEPKQGQTVHLNIYQHNHDGESKPTFKKDPDKEFDEFRWLSTKEKLPEDIAGALAHPNDVCLDHLRMLK